MQSEPKNGTYRWWLLTWNNPQVDWQVHLQDFKADYAIGQLERGENGTPHIQGVLYFHKARRGTSFKEKECWIKGIASRDAENVIRYCKKNDTRIDGPIELGLAPKSVRETKDWDLAKDLAQKGRFLDIQSSILIPYISNLQKLHALSSVPRQTSDVRGIWIFGPPGTGKSHSARNDYGQYYIKAQNKWFDGYMGQPTIILDDLDEHGGCLGHYLKIWADKWPCYGEIKGGTTALQHENFIITSNYMPSDPIFKWQGPMLEAIERRFKVVDFSFKSNLFETHAYLKSLDIEY